MYHNMQFLCVHKKTRVLAVYRRTGHNAQYKARLITKAESKYEIDHTCDTESHRWFTKLIVVRVITQFLSVNNSHHAVLVYKKPCRVMINTV